MPSQEESAQFELEFNLRDNERQMSSVGYGDSSDAPKAKVPAVSVPEHATDDNGGWEEQDSQGEDGPAVVQTTTASSRKRYTQKRSTRLHKSELLLRCFIESDISQAVIQYHN